jgi:hypothetical protein
MNFRVNIHRKGAKDAKEFILGKIGLCRFSRKNIIFFALFAPLR